MVHMTSIGTYLSAKGIRDYVHHTVAISNRMERDLVAGYGFQPDRISCIPNFLTEQFISRFQHSERTKDDPRIRLLLLGRMVDRQKGIFKVPMVLKELKESGVPYECLIAGDGPDSEEMKNRCTGLSVVFLGRISSDAIPNLLMEGDILLFPSYFEGFPLALLEGMAGGLVPVSSHLSGITDMVIKDGENGFLISSGNPKDYARVVKNLHEHRDQLAAMSRRAQATVMESFTDKTLVKKYIRLFEKVGAQSLNLPQLSLDEWEYPKEFKPGLRTYLPESIKNRLRFFREKMASIRLGEK